MKKAVAILVLCLIGLYGVAQSAASAFTGASERPVGLMADPKDFDDKPVSSDVTPVK